MLKTATAAEVKKILEFCSRFPLGTRIACQIEAYGFKRSFFQVWFSESENGVSSVLAVFDNVATLCATEDALFYELKTFIAACGFVSVCTDTKTCERLGFKDYEEKRMFIYNNKTQASKLAENCPEELYKNAYNLISRSIPGSFPSGENAYLSWLSDFTFRKRRMLARMKAVFDENTVYSCAMTAAECKTAAIISGVACDERERGKGLGKLTVLTLANELLKEGKSVYVIALNDSACTFYEKTGFSHCTDVRYIQIK